MINPYRLILLLVCCYSVTAASAQPIATRVGKQLVKNRHTKKHKLPTPHTIKQLQQQLQALLEKEEFTAASVAVCVAREKQVLFAYNADKLLTPASNMKLYTTATALTKMAADYRIRTSVYSATPVDENGKIHGNLILYGRGDPSLNSRFLPPDNNNSFQILAEQLAKAGIKEVQGNLIGDESYLRGIALGQGWEWMDLQWYFGAEISALTSNDNSVEVAVKPAAQAGLPAIITITPDVGYVKLENHLVTMENRQAREIGMQRGLQDNTLLVWGQIPLSDNGFQARVAVHRPTGLALALFRQALTNVGIEVSGDNVIVDASLLSPLPPTQTEGLTELAAIESPPLADLVRVINKFSHNLYAESLLRVMGRVLNPAVRESDEAGIEVIKSVLKDAGIEVLEIHDGSGLSRRTLVSAAATAKLLNYMQQQPNYPAFQASLPIAGVDGSLTQRMAGSVAANNVQAKTGTLTHTSALAGYVTAATGEPLVFSIIINHFTGEMRQARALENEICILLAGFSQKLEKEKERR